MLKIINLVLLCLILCVEISSQNQIIIKRGKNKLNYFSSVGVDITPPSAPQNLLAVGGADKVDLTWVDPTSSDLAKIYVYRDETIDPITLLDSVAVGVLTYVDTPLVNGTKYFYKLKARDNSYNYSVLSDNAHATPGYEYFVTSDINYFKTNDNKYFLVKQ